MTVEFVRLVESTAKHRQAQYQCPHCGRIFVRRIRRESLPYSCGCIRRARTHGHDRQDNRTPELRAWHKIRERCLNPKTRGYENYGGRGIEICARWREDFLVFLSDMGPRPSPKHTVERVDVNGHYEPENCIWLLKSLQSRNRRNTVWVTVGEKTQTVSEWIRELGISKTSLYRKARGGTSVAQQISERANA